jgi:hypothetical protein
MELLKVFVGDGTASPASVAAMTKGDVLLLNAVDYTPYASGSGDVVVAVCTDKGVEYSSPIKKTNVLYGNYVTSTSYLPKIATFTINDSDIVAGGTYSVGVQIKEDLRMGTYNKNTEVIASHTCPSSVADTPATVTSTLAKGFSANPLTSAGSPYQLVKVERTGTGTITALGQTLTVVTGAREVTAGAAVTIAAGAIVSIAGVLYLVEKGVTSGTIFSLDTAYQGASATVASGTTSSTVGTVATVTADTWAFKFTAVAQSQKNRYDQFRVVEFDVIYPKGWIDSAMAVTQATRQPVGSYRQVRDLEEKAYTNANPLINYREFPFEDFVLNADPTQNSYALLTLTYNLTSGYNYMQSNMKEFPQTLVVAAPVALNALFDNTPASGTTFASLFNTWYGSTLITSNPTP